MDQLGRYMRDTGCPEADTPPYRTHESERESNARDTFCE